MQFFRAHTLLAGAALLVLQLLSPLARAQVYTHFGADTAGGLTGRAIRVTTLAANGPGSLRAALAERGARLIVFDVGGAIDLGREDLILTEPHVTIAGETAPSPGITLLRGGMKIATHDVVMTHLRFRMGDAGHEKKSGYESDVSVEGPYAWNVRIAHCSIAWGTDENLSVSGPRYDGPLGTARKVTLAHNIIAQGLLESTHTKGRHSMGTLVHDYVSEVAIIGNLYAHNDERNPWFKGGSSGVVLNNFIYNPGRWAIRLGYNPKEWTGHTVPQAPQVAIVGNVMQAGANTTPGLALVGSNAPDHTGAIYMMDNQAWRADGSPAELRAGSFEELLTPPLWPHGYVARPAARVREEVLTQAGARPAERDSVDQQLIADIRAGGGHMINSQDEAGGYPAPRPTRHPRPVPPAAERAAWLESLAAKLEGRTH